MRTWLCIVNPCCRATVPNPRVMDQFGTGPQELRLQLRIQKQLFWKFYLRLSSQSAVESVKPSMRCLPQTDARFYRITAVLEL